VIGNIQKLLIYIYYFFIPFLFWDIGGTTDHYIIFKISSAAVLASSFLYLFKKKVYLDYRYFIVSILLFYAYYYLINLTYVSMSDFLLISIFIITLYHSNTNSRFLDYCISAYIVGNIIVSFFYIINYNVIIQFDRVTMFKLGNQNGVAVNSAITILVILYRNFFFPEFKNSRTNLWLFFLPQLILLLIATGSRSGMFTMLFGALVMLLFNKRILTFRNIRKFFIGFIVFGLLVQYILSQPIVKQRYNDTMEGSFSGREVYWEEILHLIKDNAIFGLGIEQYEKQMVEIHGNYASPHNVFLEVFVKSGIIGLLLLIIFLAKIVIRSIQLFMKTNDIILIILLVPIIIMSLVGHVLGTHVTWLLLAFIVYKTKEVLKFDNNIAN